MEVATIQALVVLRVPFVTLAASKALCCPLIVQQQQHRALTSFVVESKFGLSGDFPFGSLERSAKVHIANQLERIQCLLLLLTWLATLRLFL